MKIYVASSWRNTIQPLVVTALTELGHDVYDFKNPTPDNHGFHWSEIDPEWKNWTASEFKNALNHPIAEDCFQRDEIALKECDVCVLVLPCGRSAHLEAGYALGAGKPTVILLTGDNEPELMYKFTQFVCVNMDEVIQCIDYLSPADPEREEKTDELISDIFVKY